MPYSHKNIYLDNVDCSGLLGFIFNLHGMRAADVHRMIKPRRTPRFGDVMAWTTRHRTQCDCGHKTHNTGHCAIVLQYHPRRVLVLDSSTITHHGEKGPRNGIGVGWIKLLPGGLVDVGTKITCPGCGVSRSIRPQQLNYKIGPI